MNLSAQATTQRGTRLLTAHLESLDPQAVQARERLEVQHRQVLADLRREVGQLAIDLAGRIVGESLGDKELQRRVVDRFRLHHVAHLLQDQRMAFGLERGQRECGVMRRQF